MAGGRGERLRPLTDTCPKPLLPVAGRPVLDRLLEKLAEAGIQDVTLAVGYLGQMIEDYVGDGARWGVRADYVRQVQPMGTAGALGLLTFGAVGDTGVMVVNGDKVIELAEDVRQLERAYTLLKYDMVIATTKYQIPYGVVRDAAITEKPSVDVVAGFYAFTGSLLLRVEPVMDMPKLAAMAECSRAHPFAGYVLDIGTPQTYQEANARLSDR